jgi:RNA polymerase sigma factor (sigma-70 family)
MMVRAVARRLLENAHDAEDVCQAAFLLLAQKAGTGRWQPSVANWLYQTAHHLSLKVRTANLRRDRRQKNAINPPAKDPLTEMTARELLTVLDEELLALPETLRTPLVHCYLEGATQDEAAKRMQCSVHTVKKRLERGRLKLSAALARRGIGFSAALAGTLAAQCSLAGIPASLARGIVRSAKSLADGCLVEAAVPQGVRQLLNGAKGMTSYFKIKVTLSVLFLTWAPPTAR